jgi:hypothetical protein
LPDQAKKGKMAQNASKELFMAAPSNFASVKLSATLVQEAREAAQPLRRSAAGQIEYWATLGRVVEHSGLTAQEAQTAIEGYEAAARKSQQARAVSDLTSRLLAAEVSGSLARRVREVVEENRKLAN